MSIAGLITAFSGSLFKIVAAGLAGAALLGGGYLWGSTDASAAAMADSAKAAQAQVAAVSTSYQATIADYAAKLKAQAAHGDHLVQALDQIRTQLAASAAIAKETIAHDVPTNSVCDLPAGAVDVLRAQPARH